MKTSATILLRITLLIMTSLLLFAKPDSTEINIKVGFQDSETNLLANLINVEKITVSFSDINLIGKKFMISQVEYVNGEKKEDKALFKCGKDTITTMVGEDTIHYLVPDMCERASYQKDDSSFIIHFLCDNSKDTTKITIRYPGLWFDIKIAKKVSETYLLRDLIACGDHKGMIPVNNKIPIVSFTPPFDMGNGSRGYCILNYKPVEEWNKYYKLNHYVVFYLEIKD